MAICSARETSSSVLPRRPRNDATRDVTRLYRLDTLTLASVSDRMWGGWGDTASLLRLTVTAYSRTPLFAIIMVLIYVLNGMETPATLRPVDFAKN